MDSFDVAVVGAGVVGCSTLYALSRRDRSLKLALIEKEFEPALHQSGRNSGVIHVGYNQKPGSLKARYVVEGNRRVSEFCRAEGVPMHRGGILVVARSETQASGLGTLLENGRANGACVEQVDACRLREIEPRARGVSALWAPEGGSLDAPRFVERLLDRSAPKRFFGEKVSAVEESGGWRLRTPRTEIRSRVWVNAGGLEADRLARMVGLGRGLAVVPFRGEYYDFPPDRHRLVRSHIYPAPDPNFPFLGVHLSRRMDGRVSIGPGAMLVLGREAYAGFLGTSEDLGDLIRFPGFWRMLASGTFIRRAMKEWGKSVSRASVWSEARRLVPELCLSDLGARWSGIRAQLVDASGRFVDDLRVERTRRSLHVLNAVSPALTCSLPLAEQLAGTVVSMLEDS